MLKMPSLNRRHRVDEHLSPVSSETSSGNGTKAIGVTATSSAQTDIAGKKATRRPGTIPSDDSTLGPTSLITPAPSNPGMRPPGPNGGGSPKAGDPRMPRTSPGWTGTRLTRTRTDQHEMNTLATRLLGQIRVPLQFDKIRLCPSSIKPSSQLTIGRG